MSIMVFLVNIYVLLVIYNKYAQSIILYVTDGMREIPFTRTYVRMYKQLTVRERKPVGGIEFPLVSIYTRYYIVDVR